MDSVGICIGAGRYAASYAYKEMEKACKSELAKIFEFNFYIHCQYHIVS